MPVDPGANPKDKAKAIAVLVFLVVFFIALYFVVQATAPAPKEDTVKGSSKSS